ncbi:Uncharacterized protein GBIM_12907 [Gryllus bimaculatus]|nr:Uncharacterized protein GBIM_12907 [Gryllus bimaculatus]
MRWHKSRRKHAEAARLIAENAPSTRYTHSSPATRPPRWHLLWAAASQYFSFEVELTARTALVVAAILALLAAQCIPLSDAVPTHYSSDAHECLRHESTEALCQRCAKSTKSTMVYPMCCRNQEEVREWCVRYLDYGLQ